MLSRLGLYLTPLLAMLMTACATTPPPPAQTTTSLGLDASLERLVQAATAAGLATEPRADGVTVRTNDPRFITCQAVSVGGGGGDSSRSVFTQVSERRAVADVRLENVGGQTRASWQTSFTGRYHNRVNNTFFERPCASSGALEALFVRALAGA